MNWFLFYTYIYLILAPVLNLGLADSSICPDSEAVKTHWALLVQSTNSPLNRRASFFLSSHDDSLFWRVFRIEPGNYKDLEVVAQEGDMHVEFRENRDGKCMYLVHDFTDPRYQIAIYLVSLVAERKEKIK